MCGVAFTDRLLKGELMWGKNLKEEIRRVDRAQLLDRCGLRSLPYSTSGEASWMGKSLGCSLRLWGLTYQGAPVVEQGIEPPWEG